MRAWTIVLASPSDTSVATATGTAPQIELPDLGRASWTIYGNSTTP
jgi:hypothetical protein